MQPSISARSYGGKSSHNGCLRVCTDRYTCKTIYDVRRCVRCMEIRQPAGFQKHAYEASNNISEFLQCLSHVFMCQRSRLVTLYQRYSCSVSRHTLHKPGVQLLSALWCGTSFVFCEELGTYFYPRI